MIVGPQSFRFLSVGTLKYPSAVFPTFLLADTFWLRKITMYPHILAHVNILSPKLKIYVSEFISDGYEHIPIAWRKMYCMTVP
jgi:hypothetical protein